MAKLFGICRPCEKYLARDYPEFSSDEQLRSLKVVCKNYGGYVELLTEQQLQQEISDQVDRDRARSEVNRAIAIEEVRKNKKQLLRYLAPVVKFGGPFLIAAVTGAGPDHISTYIIFFMSLVLLNVIASNTNDFFDLID